MTTVALVEDSRAFICTSQLLGVVADLFAAAFFAALGNDAGCVHIVFRDSLHL